MAKNKMFCTHENCTWWVSTRIGEAQLATMLARHEREVHGMPPVLTLVDPPAPTPPGGLYIMDGRGVRASFLLDRDLTMDEAQEIKSWVDEHTEVA
jgi:hypothetical protein